MQEWKKELINKTSELINDQRIVWFRKEVAEPLGYNHIKTEDVRFIAREVLKLHPNYVSKHDISNPLCSLFNGLFFCEKGFIDEEASGEYEV